MKNKKLKDKFKLMKILINIILATILIDLIIFNLIYRIMKQVDNFIYQYKLFNFHNQKTQMSKLNFNNKIKKESNNFNIEL